MKNKTLCIIRGSIPYVRELRKHVGSVTATILMQQLDYWFAKYPGGFYKFLSPTPNHDDYKEGDSWTEELQFSLDEFRTAFDKIGVRYSSKTQFNKAENCFAIAGGEEKFYCSYHDKKLGLTWYFRNHCLVDMFLDSVFTGEEDGVRRSQKGRKPRRESQSTVNRESQSTEMDNPNLYKQGLPTRRDDLSIYISENTTETSEEPPVPQVPHTPPPTPVCDVEDLQENLSSQEEVNFSTHELSSPTSPARPNLDLEVPPNFETPNNIPNPEKKVCGGGGVGEKINPTYDPVGLQFAERSQSYEWEERPYSRRPKRDFVSWFATKRGWEKVHALAYLKKQGEEDRTSLLWEEYQKKTNPQFQSVQEFETQEDPLARLANCKKEKTCA